MGFLRRLIGGEPSADSRTLPAVPPPPPAPHRPERPHNEVVGQYANEACPYCGERMQPLPKAKTRCKACRQPVYVRTGPDGLRYLLEDVDLPTMEAEWLTVRAHDAAEQDRVENEYAQALVAEAWQLTFGATPSAKLVDLSSDDEDEDPQEVHGESHYQGALAELSNLADGVVQRRTVVAVLLPEPRNKYDRNAVRVEVFGRLVGYIPRDDAARISKVLIDLQKKGMHVASRAEIIGGGIGRSGDRLSFGIVLRMKDYSDWAATFHGKVTVRSAASP